MKYLNDFNKFTQSEETNEGLLDDLGRFFIPKKHKHIDPKTIQSEK